MINLLANLVWAAAVAFAVRICWRNLKAMLRDESHDPIEQRDRDRAALEAAKARHPSNRARMMADLATPGVLTPNQGQRRVLTEDDPEWIEYSKRIKKHPHG